MSIIKCKMCGGTVDFNPGETVGVCDFCGTKQTLPKANDEVITNLFNRANNLRLKCEFDKAEQIYEKIVQQDDSEAEAHWGIILCKYGIEYVEDPKTFERVPTCHRTRFESIKTDADYEAAIDYADTLQQSIYEKEARAIDKLQKDILAIVKNEKPFDVFICYKETDDSGRRTVDSTLANDIYHQLTQNGLKVFYAAITLEDKLGQEYEPYIFAALNSAKVMLVIGTKPEYFTAVWVKNEWSRFMNLMKTDRSKILIPCYRDMDAYDLPEEFAHLQAQDMSRIGFIQDIIRGVEKVVGKETLSQVTASAVDTVAGPTADTLLKRGYISLEDGLWEKADEFFEQALNINPECAKAYLGLFMSCQKWNDFEMMKNWILNPENKIDLSKNKALQRAIQYADEKLKILLLSIQTEREKAIQQHTQRLLEKELEEREGQRKQRELQEKQKEEQKKRLKLEREKIRHGLFAAGIDFSVGLKEDGTVISTGNRKRISKVVSEWTGIVAIDAFVTIDGLCEDGTVVSDGVDPKNKKDDFSSLLTWKGIKAICSGGSGVVGLCTDGTLKVVGADGSDSINTSEESNIKNWKNIKTVALGASHAVGLCENGKVISTDWFHDANSSKRLRCSSWVGIVDVAAGWWHTVGLRSNGTVIATGKNDQGQCDVRDWKEIIAIAAGENFTVGIRANGTVVATGENNYGQCNVKSWKGIIAVNAGRDHTIGLCKDGTVVATGRNDSGQCNVSGWKLFMSEGDKDRLYNKGIDLMNLSTEESYTDAYNQFVKLKDYKDSEALKEECKNKKHQLMAERLKEEQSHLEDELGMLKGLFSGKRRREIEIRLAAIKRELQ